MKEYTSISQAESTRLKSQISFPYFRFTDITIQYHEGLWNYGPIHRCDGGLITFALTHRFLPTSNVHEETQLDGHLDHYIASYILSFCSQQS